MRDRRPVPPIPADVIEPMTDSERVTLVAEAYHTFDEATARNLATRLGIRWLDCIEEVERLRFRLQ